MARHRVGADFTIRSYPIFVASQPLIFITQIEASAGFAELLSCHVTATQFQMRKRSGTGYYVNWIAIGNGDQ